MRVPHASGGPVYMISRACKIMCVTSFRDWRFSFVLSQSNGTMHVLIGPMRHVRSTCYKLAFCKIVAGIEARWLP